MEALLKTRTMRNKLISAAAASTMTLPLFAPAAVVHDTDSDIRIAYEKTEPASTLGQQSLYAKLKKSIAQSLRLIHQRDSDHKKPPS